jgi:hypothetical protein
MKQSFIVTREDSGRKRPGGEVDKQSEGDNRASGTAERGGL